MLATQFIIDTNGEGMPQYLTSFIGAKIAEGQRTWYIPHICMLEGEAKEIVSKNLGIDPKNATLITGDILFSDVVPEKEYTHYVNIIFKEILAKFCAGCGFKLVSFPPIFIVPRHCFGAGVPTNDHSKKTLVLHNDDHTSYNTVITLLVTLFNYTHIEAHCIASLVDKQGSYAIDVTGNPEMLRRVNEVFSKSTLKYSIY